MCMTTHLENYLKNFKDMKASIMVIRGCLRVILKDIDNLKTIDNIIVEGHLLNSNDISFVDIRD